jgi:hypothetical protein
MAIAAPQAGCGKLTDHDLLKNFGENPIPFRFPNGRGRRQKIES